MATEPSMGQRRSQRRRKHERLQAAELVPATLLRHPMFAALAGVRNPAKVGQFSVALSVGRLRSPASIVYHPCSVVTDGRFAHGACFPERE